MPDHSEQDFRRTPTATQFFYHVVQTSQIRVHKLGLQYYALFYCFSTLRFFNILFQIYKTKHSQQKLRETSTVTRFFQHVILTNRLGTRFKALFYCFMHSISSKFCSKSYFPITPNRNFEKRRPLLSFFYHVVQTSLIRVHKLGLRF